MNAEMVLIFGRLTTVAKVAGIGAAIVAGMVFFAGGPQATAWLLAAGAGCVAWPLLGVFRAKVVAGVTMPRGGRTPAAAVDHPAESAVNDADVDIDDILAKISRRGLDALTPTERERLELARRAKSGE